MASTTTVIVNGKTLGEITSGTPVDITDPMFTHISDNPFIALNNVLIRNTAGSGAEKLITKYIGFNVNKLILCDIVPMSTGMTLNSAVPLKSIISRARVGIFQPVRLKEDGSPEKQPVSFGSSTEGIAMLESIINKNYLKFGIVATYNAMSKYFWPVTISPTPKEETNIEPWAAYALTAGSAVSPGGMRYPASTFYAYEVDLGTSTLGEVYNDITNDTSVTFQLVSYVAESTLSVGETPPTSMSYLTKYTAAASSAVSALKPSTVNNNTVTVANADNNNRDYYDGEGVGYGWVGSYDPSTDDDSKIIITVEE